MRKVDQRTNAEILEKVIHVSGHADECTEPQIHTTMHELYRLQNDLSYMQTLLDKELTRRYNELAEKGTPTCAN
jgi:hypothetical protein